LFGLSAEHSERADIREVGHDFDGVNLSKCCLAFLVVKLRKGNQLAGLSVPLCKNTTCTKGHELALILTQNHRDNVCSVDILGGYA